MIQPEENLSAKVIKGGMWIFAMRIIGRGLSVLRMVVMARLLAPEDFGLMGIALISMATLETFSQTGFHASLLQKDSDVRNYLDTAWTVSVVRGMFLLLVLWLAAPWIASFFNSPAAVSVIRIVSVSSMLNGCRNIGMIYFEKELELNKKAVFELSAILINFFVALTLAFLLKNVWALVWGDLAANFARLVLSYFIHPYRPRLKMETDKLAELFSFGRWVYLSTVLVFLVTKGDDFFVGKILGAAALGYYQMAFMISNLPTTEISHVISSVTFPAYAKLQKDIPRLRQAYIKVFKVTVFIVTPIAGLLLIMAEGLIAVFLGQKWISIVPVVKILTVGGLIRAVAATTGPVFHGLGIPSVDTFWQVIRLLVLAACIYPLSNRWGLSGVSTAVLLSIFVSTLGFMAMVISRINAETVQVSKIVLGPLISTGIMMAVIQFFKQQFGSQTLTSLLALTVLGTSVYLAASWLYDKLFKTAIISTLLDFSPIIANRNPSNTQTP